MTGGSAELLGVKGEAVGFDLGGVLFTTTSEGASAVHAVDVLTDGACLLLGMAC